MSPQERKMIPTLFSFCSLVLFLAAVGSSAVAYNHIGNHQQQEHRPNKSNVRRNLIGSTFIYPLVTVFNPVPSNAFDNKLQGAYANVTPQVGQQPTDLGVSERASRSSAVGSYKGLKPCATSPNCWCSSAPFADNPARYLAPWKGSSIQDVKKVIDSYEVGQQGIDGGGFAIIDYDEKNQYIYVQFQSYKSGYIDDFEMWYNPKSQAFDVRSSSRLGYSDLGVNAKRLNYIGDRLEKEHGWTLERRKSGSLV
jgi:uncharacterized protein (DUF1499 family)